MRIIIVSGLAGSGKTVAIRALEDLGYQCIDNLPAALLDSFVASVTKKKLKEQNIALALDSREPEAPKILTSYISQLKKHAQVDILFFEASTSVLLRRFKETRRAHPLTLHKNEKNKAENLIEAIKKDSQFLKPLRKYANKIIDTSSMASPYLRELIRNTYSAENKSSNLQLTLISFGFKHGAPESLDMILDVRCFSNPYYVPSLRKLTGLQPKVRKHVFADKGVAPFLKKVTDLLLFLYPLYVKEGKHYFAIGIGCTGGKHRSVAIVEELCKRLRKKIPIVKIEHRHIEKE